MSESVQIPSQQPISVRIVLPSVFALREFEFGAKKRLVDLAKLEKKVVEEGVSNHDVRMKMKVWEGDDGLAGVIAQLNEQLHVFAPPPPEPMLDGQMDAFDGATAYGGVEGRGVTARQPKLTPAELRDQLQEAGVYVPAAVLRRMPAAERVALEEWAAAVAAAQIDPSVEIPAQPESAVDYLLPDGFSRDDSGVVWDDEAQEQVGFDQVEEIVERALSAQEDAALQEPTGERPWLVVDTGIGIGVARYQVMHRETRERRPVDTEWVARWAHLVEGENLDDYHLNLATGYAVALSHSEPIPGDVEGFARYLRDRLFRLGYSVRLVTILDWSADQRMAAAEWVESDSPRPEDVPDCVPAGHVLEIELPAGVVHPDADYDEHVRATLAQPAVAFFPEDDCIHGNAVTASCAVEPSTSVEAPTSPAVEVEDGPAPAHVASMLAKAGRRVPLEIVKGWDGNLSSVAVTWSGLEIRSPGLYEIPEFLAALPWQQQPDGSFAVPASGPLSFKLVGMRKPVRVLDAESGLHYGAQWSMQEAQAVLLAWTSGEPAILGEQVLQVRDASVCLDVRD